MGSRLTVFGRLPAALVAHPPKASKVKSQGPASSFSLRRLSFSSLYCPHTYIHRKDTSPLCFLQSLSSTPVPVSRLVFFCWVLATTPESASQLFPLHPSPAPSSREASLSPTKNQPPLSLDAHGNPVTVLPDQAVSPIPPFSIFSINYTHHVA